MEWRRWRVFFTNSNFELIHSIRNYIYELYLCVFNTQPAWFYNTPTLMTYGADVGPAPACLPPPLPSSRVLFYTFAGCFRPARPNGLRHSNKVAQRGRARIRAQAHLPDEARPQQQQHQQQCESGSVRSVCIRRPVAEDNECVYDVPACLPACVRLSDCTFTHKHTHIHTSLVCVCPKYFITIVSEKCVRTREPLTTECVYRHFCRAPPRTLHS